MRPKKKPEWASCHPERPNRSLGLCEACYKQQYNAKHPLSEEKIRIYSQRQRFKKQGITGEFYQEELDKLPDGRCLLCRLFPDETFHIDHSHITGKYRGLLCPKCNTALGLFLEDIPTLQRAIDYLKKHEVLFA